MANTRGPRATRVSFLVPFVGIKQQLREGLPWKSIAVLALLMVASVILRCSGWCPACLTTGAPGRMLLVANLLMTFILLVPQGIPAELMLLFIGAVCSLAGILTSKELFQGCASDAVVTLALLFPIMKAMGDTGVPERFIGCMLGSAKGPYSLIIRMFFSVAILSGVFNNTPIVVMMIPLLQSLCLRQGVPSPAVLMPLSFAAQAGGSLTKMGSSINFVADEVFRANGYGIGFFTLTLGCIFICLLGGAYCAMMGPKVLMPVSDAVESSASRGGTNLFKVAFCPSEDGPLVGQSLEDLGLHRIPGVEEITLHRWHDVELVEAGVVDSNATAQSLQLEDSLYARCSAEGVAQLRRVRGLELCNDDELNLLGSKRRQRCLCEAAVKETLHGQRVSLRRFKRELRCAVVAVRSGAESVESEWREGFEGYEIQYGDVLLIEAFQEMFGSEPWLEHFSVTRRVPDSEPPRRGTKADDLRAIFIVVGLLIMIIIASGGKRAPSLPLMAVIFLCGIIAVKGLSLPEAYQEVNGPVLLTIVGALALGRAMELSGLANCLATALVALTRPLGAGAVKLGIYLATVGLGQFLNSAANVAIMGKIAIPIAHSMEIAVGEMALVVTYAASACYTAPYGYQTNTLVLRAGGYVWGDFVKFGGILQLLHMLLVVSMAGWWAKFSP